MAASAALRAIDELARNFGRKSSTAMASWSVTFPITRPVAGSDWTSAGTTNEAFQWPTLSRYTRTLDGSAGNARDHTTVSTMPPARCRRPSLSRKPRRVQLSVGSASRFLLYAGIPARRRCGRPSLMSLSAFARDLPKSRTSCCCGTDEPSASHGVTARASVSILSSRADTASQRPDVIALLTNSQ
jgi:hypothetical protein